MPGEGNILIDTPIEALIKRSGMKVEDFIQYVRSGCFDHYKSGEKFSTNQDYLNAVCNLDKSIISSIPSMEGTVTWRRAQRAWSIDVTHTFIDNKIRYWSNVAKDVCQISIEGVNLPDTLVSSLVGKPLCEVVEHEIFADPNIKILNVTVFKPIRGSKIVLDDNGSTQFHVRMSKSQYPDPHPL